MGQKFRTATPMGDWRSLLATCVDTNGYDEGDLVLVEATVGMVFLSIPPLDANGCVKDPPVQLGDDYVLIYHIEKVIVDKEAQVACVKGAKVYWSGVAGDPVTPTHASDLYWIGIFTEDAAAADETVEIDLKGDKATLLE